MFVPPAPLKKHWRASSFFQAIQFFFNKVKTFSFKTIPGSITAAKGYAASGVFCDIKRLGTGKGSDKGYKRDLALIVSKAEATVVGTFTTNQVCAAPVKLCVQRMEP